MTCQQPAQELAGQADDLSGEELIARVRRGDREAAAAFIARNESLIRRRLRHRLGRVVRRVFDSQDIVSTIARRLDRLVGNGGVETVSREHLWNLVLRIGDHAIVDKARMVARSNRAEERRADPTGACLRDGAPMRNGACAGCEPRVEAVLSMLDNPMDRAIVSQWLMGRPLSLIADDLGVTPSMVRKRWERIRAELRRRLGPGESP